MDMDKNNKINPDFQEKILQAAKFLSSSTHAVAFTGAGISTPSGIPDFRSPKSGLWESYNPFQVASIDAFNHHPRDFFNWIKPLAIQAGASLPNAAHLCLAKLEKNGIIKAIITQNIDDLHQKAGSKKILELHGNARTATCPHCLTKHDRDEYMHILTDSDDMPKCKTCNKIIKPDVVLFGEMLPQQIWAEAYAHCAKADVMLVVGSSLEVAPANTLPEICAQNNAHLIINNLSATHLDRLADILLPIDVTLALEGICHFLLE